MFKLSVFLVQTRTPPPCSVQTVSLRCKLDPPPAVSRQCLLGADWTPPPAVSREGLLGADWTPPLQGLGSVCVWYRMDTAMSSPIRGLFSCTAWCPAWEGSAIGLKYLC